MSILVSIARSRHYSICVLLCSFGMKAARTSLASVVAELVGVLPKIGSCRKAADLMTKSGVERFKICVVAVVMVFSGCSRRCVYNALEEH